MNLIKIDDINIKELEIYHKLRDNAFDEDNSFIADSPKVVNMLLQSDIKIKSILATKEYYEEFEDLISHKDIPRLYLADRKIMQGIVGHKIHHNVMMYGTRPDETPLQNLGDNIIMLDAISSTENMGSISRSAAALGVNSFVVPKQGPHPYGRRALRVSMGYVSKLNVHIYEDIFSTIDALKARGYKIFAAEINAHSVALMEVKIPQKWVLLMGHEGKGILEDVLSVCDEIVHIEMQEGIKSFNVGVAASIMMYRFKKGI
ncbi:RNA methyltransferase [bacterium]|nr:RNA methyltransferase [bacterium]MBU1994895.1 RNA methyltransferase [bacterium]